MIKISRSRGITLTELVIASVIVSIIMLGVTTTFLSMQKSARVAGNGNFASQTAEYILNHMLTEANLAVGTASNPGIRVGVGGALFCVHQHVNPADDVSVFPGNVNSGQDRWLCYMQDVGAVKNITYCAKAYDPSNGDGSYGISANACVNTAKFLGTASSISSPANPVTVQNNIVCPRTDGAPIFSVSVSASTGGNGSENYDVIKQGGVNPPEQSLVKCL